MLLGVLGEVQIVGGFARVNAQAGRVGKQMFMTLPVVICASVAYE